MTAYEVRQRDGRARPATLLAPQTDTERRVSAWLAGWDLYTVETIACMIKRRMKVPRPVMEFDDYTGIYKELVMDVAKTDSRWVTDAESSDYWDGVAAQMAAMEATARSESGT